MIFVCSGFLVYWLARMFLVLCGSEEAIAETLDWDLWWGRRLLLGLRTMFLPPTHLAG
jgi:hypothetical protein